MTELHLSFAPKSSLEGKLAWLEEINEQLADPDERGEKTPFKISPAWFVHMLDNYMEEAWLSLPPWPDAEAERWSLGNIQWGILIIAHLGILDKDDQARDLAKTLTPDQWAHRWFILSRQPIHETIHEGTLLWSKALGKWLTDVPLDKTWSKGYYTDGQSNVSATWWGELAACWTGMHWGAWVTSLYKIKEIRYTHEIVLPEKWKKTLLENVHEHFQKTWMQDALWLIQRPSERWLYHWRHPAGKIKDPYAVLQTFRDKAEMDAVDERTQLDTQTINTLLEKTITQESDPIRDAFIIALLNNLMRSETKLLDWRNTWIWFQHELEERGIEKLEEQPWPIIVNLAGKWWIWNDSILFDVNNIIHAWALWCVLIEESCLPHSIVLNQTTIWPIVETIVEPMIFSKKTKSNIFYEVI